MGIGHNLECVEYARTSIDTHLQNTIDECVAYIDTLVKSGKITKEEAIEEKYSFYVRVLKMAAENL